ncbi:hypothetical protein L1987_41582 [Smallanthus sonchifolius]|uniref:Uncharacterized protein n=1 Tax=Smallanthus sonchifolius TaxID=185202 RepID=A0ACB9GWZ4_9ASTR|nr:hypothetical protein L1987_41582 [Smallanthus sonchifolius]
MNLPALQVLDISDNNFRGFLPFGLCVNSTRIRFLSGSFSNLSTSLKILQHSPNLTVLVLAMNFYTEQLPSDGYLLFKTLKALVISSCSLTGTIPSWLNGLTRLQLLDLSSNHFTGQIPAYLGDLKSLFYLDLSNNSFSGEIPKNLTALQTLISRDISLQEPSQDFPIYMSRNVISNTWLTLHYDEIMMFPTLLDLSNNLLTGPIWSEFGNLKKLSVLDLKHNNLSGTIPSSLSSLRNIETLDLSYNSLTGTVPLSFGNLYFLSKFSVAHNDLTGSIPSRGQFQTFSTASFEGNSGLCGKYLLKCEKTQSCWKLLRHLRTKRTLPLVCLHSSGLELLVTVFYFLVVPRLIKGYTHS